MSQHYCNCTECNYLQDQVRQVEETLSKLEYELEKHEKTHQTEEETEPFRVTT